MGKIVINNNLIQVYDLQDNIIGYRNKKINNDLKHEKKLKLKPLIFKNSSSVERLANNMFMYTKELSGIRKMNK